MSTASLNANNNELRFRCDPHLFIVSVFYILVLLAKEFLGT